MLPADYLDRIGVSGTQSPTLRSLVTLHEAHMAAVPFENLDIPLGREIVMDEERFLDKIVRQRRGGFCYELNGAFAWLLRQLGFDVTYLSAGVCNDQGVPGPDFDHMTLLVRIEDSEWLADVGFGDSFRAPLRFVADVAQADSDPRGLEYRLTEEDGRWWMSKRETARGASSEWLPKYRFSLEARRLDEYESMCRYQQTSRESSFTKRVVCSKATPEGRITLSATELIETSADGRIETPIERGMWHEVLRDRLGVILPEKIVRWP